MNIKMDNICKEYGNKKVLEGITIDLKSVTSVGIIGGSGCGKSTLLRLLSGLETQTSGTISINEQEITAETLEEHRGNIGYVFQKHNLFPHLTLKQNITIILEKIKGKTKECAESVAIAVLKQFYLYEHRDKKPAMLSGGQAQRGAIARAIATDPSIMMLDEPTSALDPLLTNEVLQAVMELKKEGKKFIFVTHEVEFLRSFADYIIFMDNGKIAEHGDISILESPQTEQLAKYIKATKHKMDK